MIKILMLKQGELVLKGLNRGRFEQRLLDTVKRRLGTVGVFRVHSMQSTIYAEPLEPLGDLTPALAAAERIFGLAAVTAAVKTRPVMEDMLEAALAVCGLDTAKSFKVEARRADKTFPLTSPQICAELGALILDARPHLRVDVHNPGAVCWAEIREGFAYIHPAPHPGAGGLPSGMSGKSALLLSGGIDSPVAGWRMARRGLELCAVHFHSYPYTSPEALAKVERLAEELSLWCGKMELLTVPFTAVQEKLRAQCPEEYFTLMMRRSMLRIAQTLARKNGCGSLITGESLGQVASQTQDAMAVTGYGIELPIFRPLAGSDKEETVVMARRIGTFETSILPYEDCCTVFTPKHPKTKPRLGTVLEIENAGGWTALEQDAAANTEKREVMAHDC